MLPLGRDLIKSCGGRQEIIKGNAVCQVLVALVRPEIGSGPHHGGTVGAVVQLHLHPALGLQQLFSHPVPVFKEGIVQDLRKKGKGRGDLPGEDPKFRQEIALIGPRLLHVRIGAHFKVQSSGPHQDLSCKGTVIPSGSIQLSVKIAEEGGELQFLRGQVLRIEKDPDIGDAVGIKIGPEELL